MWRRIFLNGIWRQAGWQELSQRSMMLFMQMKSHGVTPA